MIQDRLAAGVNLGKSEVLQSRRVCIVPHIVPGVDAVGDTESPIALQLAQFVRVELQVVVGRGNLAVCNALEPLQHRLIRGVTLKAADVLADVCDTCVVDSSYPPVKVL